LGLWSTSWLLAGEPRCQIGSCAPDRAPYRHDHDLFIIDDVVHVEARAPQQQATNVLQVVVVVADAGERRMSEQVERRGELVHEKIGRSQAVRAPPLIDVADFSV